MPKNLDYKIAILLDDLQGLTREDKAKRIKALVEEELEWKQTTHLVDNYDLTLITSFATKYMTDMSINHMRETAIDGDSSKQRALSYLEAVIGFLRKESLIPFKLTHVRKK